VIELEPGVRVRRATLADLDAIVAIKRSLPMPRAAQTSTGGFLLGCEVERYRALLPVSRTWLLEVEGVAAGFALTLDDPVLRSSPLWARREQICWDPDFDVAAALTGRVAYFDQLALLASVRQRYWGGALALRALIALFDEAEHTLVLTTTVIEPVRNDAALPHLARIGARQRGRVDEHYPEVGPIVSAVHVIEVAEYRERLAALARAPETRQVVEPIVAEQPGPQLSEGGLRR
jgi:hypothetical protein